jgi:two-component system chemotaxis response regulator CheB
MQALEEGAVDFIPKPTNDLYHNLEQYSDVLIAKVKTAMVYYHSRQQNAEPTGNSAANASHADQSTPFDTDRIIAIGASTGGTEAIKSVLVALPSNMPPIVITQHLPVPFTTYFAQRLDRSTILNVSVAAEDETLLPGHVYLAPGDRHLEVRRHKNRYRCHLNDKAPVNRHKPSVDVLFNSLAGCAGTKAIAVLLSGMGRDGAYGMAEMHKAGADTLAQDENSCVVWGMPGYATRLGCVDHVASPAMLPRLLIDLSACGDRAPHMPIGDSDNHLTSAPGNT